MNKWKEEFCSKCDFCVDRRCRDTKPVDGRYLMVVTLGSSASDTPACSNFEPKPKEAKKTKKKS